jgi:hypothetical protein
MKGPQALRVSLLLCVISVSEMAVGKKVSYWKHASRTVVAEEAAAEVQAFVPS